MVWHITHADFSNLSVALGVAGQSVESFSMANPNSHNPNDDRRLSDHFSDARILEIPLLPSGISERGAD